MHGMQRHNYLRAYIAALINHCFEIPRNTEREVGNEAEVRATRLRPCFAEVPPTTAALPPGRKTQEPLPSTPKQQRRDLLVEGGPRQKHRLPQGIPQALLPQ